MVAMSADDEHWTSADDAGLRRRLEEATTTHLGSPDFVMNLSRNQALNSVYVLIFNPGQTDEGVYTLQGKSMRAGAYVLAFEQDDDAHRFSELLQAEGFSGAVPLRWDKMQLRAFCDSGDFEVSLVPTGAVITPPAKNEFDNEAFESLQSGYDCADTECSTERAYLENLFGQQ